MTTQNKVRTEKKSAPTSGYLPLELEVRSHVNTACASFYLARKPQTLRAWACLENGPLRPIRVHGRLSWAVADIRRVLGITGTSNT